VAEKFSKLTTYDHVQPQETPPHTNYQQPAPHIGVLA